MLVEGVLNRSDGKGGLTVVFNSAQEAAKPKRYSGAYRNESKQTMKRRDEGYVEIRDLASSQVLVLV